MDRKFDKAGGKVEGSLDVNSLVRARAFESTNPLRHRMYPDDPVVYQDIFEAKKTGAIVKLGTPNYDDTTHSTNLWNDCTYSGIIINGQKVERFMAKYDNPFARHWNSKAFARYIAARIPSSVIL
ncbi:MAG: hypothetical protein P8X90_10645 [Desulfobacterales bacterium]